MDSVYDTHQYQRLKVDLTQRLKELNCDSIRDIPFPDSLDYSIASSGASTSQDRRLPTTSRLPPKPKKRERNTREEACLSECELAANWRPSQGMTSTSRRRPTAPSPAPPIPPPDPDQEMRQNWANQYNNISRNLGGGRGHTVIQQSVLSYLPKPRPGFCYLQIDSQTMLQGHMRFFFEVRNQNGDGWEPRTNIAAVGYGITHDGQRRAGDVWVYLRDPESGTWYYFSGRRLFEENDTVPAKTVRGAPARDRPLR